jgi:RNA polymerase sigma-70 factor (ECF subfamily)
VVSLRAAAYEIGPQTQRDGTSMALPSCDRNDREELPRSPAVSPAMARAGLDGAPERGFAPMSANRAPCDVVPTHDESEGGLVERLVARDERAFNALVKAYERRVFALLLRMSGNASEAEDLAQEVFVQVFKAIGSFRGESKLSTWIYRIAINLCKNRSKYLRVRHTGEQEELEVLEQRGQRNEPRQAGATYIARPDDMVAGKQIERIVQDAILQLDPTFRECLILRDVEDLSYDEIGAITGLADGTVKSRIHRARAQLKDIVEKALGEKIG